MKKVLDHGYVRLVDHMGSDLSVVNSAKVSYDKEVDKVGEGEEKLIDFLVKNYHDSPLRHATMTFEVYAPLLIARQWWKHVVASSHLDDSEGWNESSRRYVTEEPEFYVPTWRGKAENNKQGSVERLPDLTSRIATDDLVDHYNQSLMLYEKAMSNGIAPEQARLFLPAYGLYVRWRWTTSLNAALNFVSLRIGEGAQYEIALYAKEIDNYIETLFPVTRDSWQRHRT
jgi:thymidylate synthase (FAD)